MISLAAILIAGRDWFAPVLGFAAVSLAVLWWAYRRAPANRALRVTCVFLKLLGLAALLACLLEPMWSGQRVRPGANLIAVLADNSAGMQIKDRGETLNRGQQLVGLLSGEKSKWQASLNDNFQVRNYVFDARLQSTKDFSELAFDGRSTALGSALRTITERFKGQPLAGVLLLTDGNATDLPDGQLHVEGLPPIYPVIMGRDESVKDIAIVNANVTQTSFEDAPVTVQADVTASGYSGDNVVAQLFAIDSGSDSGTKSNKASKAPAPEKVVAEQTLKAPRDGEKLAFRFQIRPEKSGVLFYRLRVAAKNELEQFTKPELSQEATLANNQTIITVDRGHGPYRILYVAGRPNWEYKFLHRALEDDEQVQLIGLIRIAKREPKFDFRGRAGESSNPLFRGFGNQSKEEIERYDQPVLVRLGTRDEVELKGGFPKVAEDLYGYHAIIVDDLEAEFFTPDQMQLVQKFVSERGGGFLMLGGAESMHEGKYQRTPVGDMLPVYLDQKRETPPEADYRLSLTREGWLQPWARLRNNEPEEKKRLTDLPAFQVFNHVREIKPGASVVASVNDGKKDYPALIVQRFGRGRTGVLAIGDFWHGGLGDEQRSKDLGKAWRQMARWLVADVPNRIELTSDVKADDGNDSMLLQVRVRDPKFLPLDNAAVTLTVRPVGIVASTNTALSSAAPAPAIKLTAEASLKEPGLYEAVYVPRDTGGYLAEATVTSDVGAELGKVSAGWVSDFAAAEFRSIKPNRALLESIAAKTGGEVLSPDKLASFVNDLALRKAPVTENWTRPLWHTPSVFLFALACFVAEWGLRRWKGLA